MVFMPKDVAGKERKLARPYHGPYRVLSLTSTNAEVQLIEHPEYAPIFVAMDRLRKCYPELPDVSWTGRRQRRHRARRRLGRVLRSVMLRNHQEELVQ